MCFLGESFSQQWHLELECEETGGREGNEEATTLVWRDRRDTEKKMQSSTGKNYLGNFPDTHGGGQRSKN